MRLERGWLRGDRHVYRSRAVHGVYYTTRAMILRIALQVTPPESLNNVEK